MLLNSYFLWKPPLVRILEEIYILIIYGKKKLPSGYTSRPWFAQVEMKIITSKSSTILKFMKRSNILIFSLKIAINKADRRWQTRHWRKLWQQMNYFLTSFKAHKKNSVKNESKKKTWSLPKPRTVVKNCHHANAEFLHVATAKQSQRRRPT